ncbi:MAG: hypothetical protein MZU97_10580 [Bacillus subtilis]|nr:hypothetical protein [Bacillus subtilis]
MLMDGYANTIDNQGTIGAASSWAFGYTPYDMEHRRGRDRSEKSSTTKSRETPTKSRCSRSAISMRCITTCRSSSTTATFITGVRFYNSSSNVLGDNTDITKGGKDVRTAVRC